MMSVKQKPNFSRITFADFKEFAKNPLLSRYEKIGFPDKYRENTEQEIFDDLCRKIPQLSQNKSSILDIGCGCSGLVDQMIANAKKREQHLVLADSEEMLALVKGEVEKVAGCFPESFSDYEEKFDAIVIYSVLQHVFLEQNIFHFIHKAATLLKEGGFLLIGDIPNPSKRKRFFRKPEGVRYHREFTSSHSPPEMDPTEFFPEKVDDAVIMSILQRFRNFGYETYLLPQNKNLPMYGRREDILIIN